MALWLWSLAPSLAPSNSQQRRCPDARAPLIRSGRWPSSDGAAEEIVGIEDRGTEPTVALLGAWPPPRTPTVRLTAGHYLGSIVRTLRSLSASATQRCTHAC